MDNNGTVFVFGGAFNPLTAAHESAIRALSRRAGDAGVILLPSGAEFVELWKPGQQVLPDAARIDMLNTFIAEAGLSNVTINSLALRENLCTYDALNRLLSETGAQRAVFVIGEDKLPELPRWAHAGELVEKTDFMVLNYARSGAEEIRLPGLEAPVRAEYLKLDAGTEVTHATYIRERMRRHDAALLDE